MAAYNTTIIDENGNIQYPLTSMNQVIDPTTGRSVGEVVEAMEDKVAELYDDYLTAIALL